MGVISILNILSFYIPIVWLVFILAIWFKKHELNFKLIMCGILVVIAVYVLQGTYYTIATYNAWKLDSVSRFFLPPYQSISYFADYAYFRFWRASLISIMVGLAWAGFLFLIKKYSGERILEKSDVALGFFTAMIVGWPKIFAYFILAFGSLIIKGIANAVILKDKSNLAIASSIAFSALVVAGFSNFIMKISFFDNWRL